MIVWIERYSETDESDSQGRWARIAYYKHSKEELLGFYKYRLGWVNRVYNTHKNPVYLLSLYFPVSNYHDGYHKSFNSYQECQTELEKLFLEFLNEIKL